MNTAIIVAAGSGTRFAGDTPKQFVELAGRPLILHTLDRFQTCDSVNEVVLVMTSALIPKFENSRQLKQLSKLVSIVAGGSTRAESVRNGLAAVSRDTKIVAVHDGARPLVSAEEISATIAKAQESGAACLVAEVTDTIKSVRGDEIIGTLDRRRLRRALTPQAFRVELLRRAFEVGEISGAATDECYLVEKLGHPISIVEGSSRNIKVTRKEDLLIAEALLSHESAGRLI